MIDIHVPVSLEYNTREVNLLAAALKKLHSFSEVAEWKDKATAEVRALHSILKALEEKQQKVVLCLSQDQQEYAAKPFLRRLFTGRKEQRRCLVEQSRLAREKTQMETLIEQLESAIGFLPRSSDEWIRVVEVCKRQKEDLINEKKAVNDRMSSIRMYARQQTANTNYGKYGSGERRRIRLNKKTALRPQGNQRTAIELQIHNLDQLITLLDGFEDKP